MPDTHHGGPSPSEQTLIRLWDLCDHERKVHGESAAATLAKRALAAVEPPRPRVKRQKDGA